MTDGKPVMVHSAARETHQQEETGWMHSYAYSDGSGREMMRKDVSAHGHGRPQKDR